MHETHTNSIKNRWICMSFEQNAYSLRIFNNHKKLHCICFVCGRIAVVYRYNELADMLSDSCLLFEDKCYNLF